MFNLKYVYLLMIRQFIMFVHFCLDTKTNQKSQALDFRRSNWFLNPKRNELFISFLFDFCIHESSISLRSNSISFYGFFKHLTLASKSYGGFFNCDYNKIFNYLRLSVVALSKLIKLNISRNRLLTRLP